MDKIVILVVIIIGLFRSLILSNTKSKSKALLVSCFVQTLPLSYRISIIVFGEKNELLGAFGSGLRIETSLIFVLLFILLGYNKLNKNSFSPRLNKWFYLMIIVCVVSIMNPINAFPLAALVPLSFLCQMYILLKILQANFSKEEVFYGIYDGLKITTFVQSFLCIMYPVLGFQEFSTMFNLGVAGEWAERRIGYASAVGTFVHPAQLALFSFFSLLFFITSGFNKHKQRLSYILVFLNAFVIFLTFSRTTYVVLISVIIIIILIFKERRQLFTLSNLLKFCLILGSIFTLLYLTPLSDIFLKSDSQEQVDNRLVHYVLGLELWQKSRWIGVGLDSHVFYMGHSFMTDPFGGSVILDFFLSNPIHNIHMIVLCELGALGLVIWLYYFVSRIYKFSSKVKTTNWMNNVYNLVFVGMLFSIFIYGFFGWAPFDPSISGICLFLGFFADDLEDSNNIP